MPRGFYPRRPVDERFRSEVDTSSDCWPRTGARLKNGYARFTRNGRAELAHRVAWELVAGPITAGFDVCHTCDNRPCCRNDDEGFYEVGGILRPRRGHLWLGTHIDNMADRNAKGRQASGERSGAKLYPEMFGDRLARFMAGHPERRARGDRSGPRARPESRLRGDEHPARKNPGPFRERLARLHEEHPEMFRGERNGRAKLTRKQVDEMFALYAAGGMTKATIGRRYGIGKSQATAILNGKSWRD